MKKTEKVLEELIKVIFATVIGYLYLLSIFSTSYISTTYNDKQEFTYYVKDNPILHLLVLLGVIGIAFILQKMKYPRIPRFIRAFLQLIIPVILLGILIVWIRATVILPAADQHDVYFAAQSFVWGDYTQLKEGGYIFIYPNQKGLMLLESVVFAIFGNRTLKIMMTLNALCLIGSLYVFRKIADLLCEKKNKWIPYASYFAIAAWIPLAFYVDFVYGNVIGFFLSSLGLWAGLLYVKTHSLWKVFAAAIAMSAAMQVKNNYLIAVLALGVILALDFLRNKRFKSLLAIVICVLAIWAGDTGVSRVIESTSHTKLGDGIPMQGWIAMGLEENEALAHGWYNGFGYSTFVESDYDAEFTKEAANEVIRERVKYMLSHPRYALYFYGRKNASQWNNPSFQCFWIYKHKLSDGDRMTWAYDVIGNNRGLVQFLNILQSLVLGGTLLYLLLNWKEMQLMQLLLPICFLGGFFFHILWEAKSQYTMSYFPLLIPYMIMGIVAAVNCLKASKLQMKKMMFAIGIIILLVVIGAIPTKISKDLWNLEENSYLLETDQWD